MGVCEGGGGGKRLCKTVDGRKERENKRKREKEQKRERKIERERECAVCRMWSRGCRLLAGKLAPLRC